MDGVGVLAFFLGAAIGVFAWFFLNRYSVRANRQIELLESIDRQLAVLAGKESNDIKNTNMKTSSKSAIEILDEARKKAGL